MYFSNVVRIFAPISDLNTAYTIEAQLIADARTLQVILCTVVGRSLKALYISS